MDTLSTPVNSPGRIAPGPLILHLFWIAIRLILVFYLGQPGVRFFYQGF